jgi:hypothetical protein
MKKKTRSVFSKEDFVKYLQTKFKSYGIQVSLGILRFLVDENLDSWVQMYKWMLSCQNYIDRDKSGWNNHGEGFPGAVLMHVLDNDKHDIVLTVRYIGGWVSDLSEIEYSLTEESDPAMVCVATLQYKYIEVEKDGIIITGRPSVNDTRESQYQQKVMGMHPSMR